MKQNADGTWSEKHGKRGNDGNSITHDNGENPDNISWDLSSISGYYDSDISLFQEDNCMR